MFEDNVMYTVAKVYEGKDYSGYFVVDDNKEEV